MKTIPFVSVIVIVLVFANSCTKSSVTDNQSPGDSTKTEQSDTVYLKKTVMDYTMVMGNPNPTDSQRTDYQYDNKRRITLIASISNTYHSADTTIFSYFSGYYKASSVTYVSGSQTGRSEIVYYQREGLTPDSAVGSESRSIFFKDANGNDTLEMYYYFPKNGPASSNYVKRFYVNNVLDSIYLSDPVFSYKYTFNSGSLTSVKTYNNGVFYSTGNYTYETILSGGFYYGESALLPLTATFDYIAAPGSGGSNVLSTYTYSFDNAQRVITQRVSHNSNANVDLQTFTYY